MNTREKGRVAETLAANWLERRGFHVKARNYLRKWGELDIVAEKDGIRHFIEVKSISRAISTISRDSHVPEENVHAFKLRQIRKMIQTYYLEQGITRETPFHFHVICVYMDFSTRKARIKWLKDVIL